ncbi:MAG: glycosyltransferase family 87 protein [Candidatus Nanopelagicales bacterium]
MPSNDVPDPGHPAADGPGAPEVLGQPAYDARSAATAVLDDDEVRSGGVVLPSEQDPLVASAVERIGGPLGRRVRGFLGYWTPLRVLVLLTTTSFVLAYLQKLPCRLESFGGGSNYSRLCYSDIPPLFAARGFADGFFPYLQNFGDRPLEYPVLTGYFMQLATWLTGSSGLDSGRTVAFFDVNALMLFACLMVTVIATALTVRRRPWDAAMVALAPGTILCLLINWDMLAVALTAVSMLMWSRSRPVWSGLLLGLAIAAKFYPVLLLGPLFLLCLRAGKLKEYAALAASAAGAWAVVNVPIMVLNFEGWAEFYSFSSTRGTDWGSLWYIFLAAGHPIPSGMVNNLAMGVLVVLCLGITWLAVGAQRRPRYAQLAFLVVAAFCITNKVYSPQYVLWLIPLAVMARPRWRDVLIWQIGEVLYFLAIWYFLLGYGTDNNKSLPEGWYVAAIIAHIGFTLWFAGMVVRDILRPEHDPIRTDGRPEHEDDPGGGVLDGADDWLAPRRYADPEPVGAHAAPLHSAHDDRP